MGGMSDEIPPPPPPPPPVMPPVARGVPHVDHGVMPYRPPGPEPRSQWWTDQGAYSAAIIYGLMGLMVLGSVIGGVWWVVAQFVGLPFWPF